MKKGRKRIGMAVMAAGLAFFLAFFAPVESMSVKVSAAPSETGAYSGKYAYARDELNRRMQNNELNPEVLENMMESMSMALIYRSLMPEEVEDVAVMNNQLDYIDFSCLLLIRMYDFTSMQMQQGTVAMPESALETAPDGLVQENVLAEGLLE